MSFYVAHQKEKFLTGSSFEEYCGGFSASSVGFKLFGSDIKKYDFLSALVESVKLAKIRGSDQDGLKENRAFFWRLFCEVKQQLPKIFRRHLRLFNTLGTPLDYYYGTDFIFLLNNGYVLVDATLNPQSEKKIIRKNPKYSLFTPYQIDRPSMVQLAKEIAEKLMDEYRLDKESYQKVKEVCNNKKNNSS